jgi:Icc-related predicted phosphoesterase
LAPIKRILFASDLHGSDVAFRKFVSAALQYHVDVALTSELTGKFIVPVLKKNDGKFEFIFESETVTAKNENEAKSVEVVAANRGEYVYYTTEEERRELNEKPEALDKIFERLMTQRLSSWISLAEEKLKGKVPLVMMMPCNDDIFALDKVLATSDFVVNPEGKNMLIMDTYEFFATGYCNMTPWKCPRDIPEEELGKKIDAMASNVKDWTRTIIHTHCPPYNTKIDNAPVLDEKFHVVYSGGAPVYHPVGSTSIRKIIEEHQPLLALHGHIHEGKGIERIGKTLCINSGSEYYKGILSGVLVNLEEDRIKGHMFIFS